jgi:site-specific DNA-methyltransferase (adenine-specific)
VIQLHNADCIEILRSLPDDSVDCCVTDPPYGLSKQSARDMTDCLQAWLSGKPYAPQKRGFMGKGWDGWVPGPEVWREVYRVLKPGGHLAAFAGSRTYDLMGLAIRLSGFEIREGLFWSSGAGFPKSHNVSNEIDKLQGAPARGRAIPVASKRLPGGRYAEGEEGEDLTGNAVPDYEPRTEEGMRWRGWGTAVKPVVEPIVLARKPLDGTIARNVLKWGVGGLNIDACRVAAPGEHVETHSRSAEAGKGKGIYGDLGKIETGQRHGQQIGRWAPGLLLTHRPGCRYVGVREVKGNGDHTGKEPGAVTKHVHNPRARVPFKAHGTDGKELVRAYACAPGCAVEAIGRMSGGSRYRAQGGDSASHSDVGTAARFFPHLDYGAEDRGGMDAAPAYADLPGYGTEEGPMLYASKASQRERNAGCGDLEGRTGAEAVGRKAGSAGTRSPRAGAGRTAETVQNHHPTVKPVAVMRWLVRLVCPVGGVVLDPFLGSGTTGVAAAMEGRGFIGIEREAAYFQIAERRVEWARQQAGPVAEVVAAPAVQAAQVPAKKGRAKVEKGEDMGVVVAEGQMRLFGM